LQVSLRLYVYQIFEPSFNKNLAANRRTQEVAAISLRFSHPANRRAWLRRWHRAQTGRRLTHTV